MDFHKLNNNPEHFDKILVERDGKIYTTKDVSIYFPTRYIKAGLASISNVVSLFMVAYIVDGDNYTVFKRPIRIETIPSGIKDVVIYDKPWKELLYKKDGIVIEKLETIPVSDDNFTLLDEWFVKSNNIPAIGYEDIMDILIEGHNITGVSLGASIVDVALLVSIIARDDNNKFLRGKYNKEQISKMNNIKYVGLANFDKGYADVLSYLSSGAYLDKGVNAAIRMGEDSPETNLDKRINI